MENMQKAILDVNDLLPLMGLSRPKLYELMNSENFPSFRIGRRLVVPTEAFYRWLNEQATAQKAN